MHGLFLLNGAHFTHITASFCFILLARYTPNTTLKVHKVVLGAERLLGLQRLSLHPIRQINI